MSVTAVGPASTLVGPAPKPREHGLLTIPGVVVNEEGTPRWLTQVNVIGFPDGTPGIWEACSVGTFRIKTDGSARPQDRFDPFGVYFALPCSTQSMGNYDTFYQQVEDALDATLSHSVEDAISRGVGMNPYFGDADFDVLATTVSPRIGLSYLENAIGERTGREGMIHATPAIVTAWGAGGGLTEDEDGVLRTTSGTPVADGSGYIGAHPLGGGGLPGPTWPSGTKEWAFATGPVEVRWESEVRRRVEESVDRSDNSVVVRAERYVVAEWDKALQVGVYIDWSLSP